MVSFLPPSGGIESCVGHTIIPYYYTVNYFEYKLKVQQHVRQEIQAFNFLVNDIIF